jgi:hypothetical protein
MLNGLLLALRLAAPATDAPSLVVAGPDGKTRAFTVADLEAMASREVEATDPHDATGPFRLVVPSDKRGARRVRQLARIRYVAVGP